MNNILHFNNMNKKVFVKISTGTFDDILRTLKEYGGVENHYYDHIPIGDDGDWEMEYGIDEKGFIRYSSDGHFSNSDGYMELTAADVKWNIGKAKPGDFLSCTKYMNTDGKPFVCIFRGMTDPTEFSSFVFVDYLGEVHDGVDAHDPNGVSPASTSQRIYLIDALKKAGYIWDGETMKLRRCIGTADNRKYIEKDRVLVVDRKVVEFSNAYTIPKWSPEDAKEGDFLTVVKGETTVTLILEKIDPNFGLVFKAAMKTYRYAPGAELIVNGDNIPKFVDCSSDVAVVIYPSTDDERQTLLKALDEENYVYDKDDRKVRFKRFKPKNGETWFNVEVQHWKWVVHERDNFYCSYEKGLWEDGNCFATREEAQNVCDNLNELCESEVKGLLPKHI